MNSNKKIFPYPDENCLNYNFLNSKLGYRHRKCNYRKKKKGLKERERKIEIKISKYAMAKETTHLRCCVALLEKRMAQIVLLNFRIAINKM